MAGAAIQRQLYERKREPPWIVTALKRLAMTPRKQLAGLYLNRITYCEMKGIIYNPKSDGDGAPPKPPFG